MRVAWWSVTESDPTVSIQRPNGWAERKAGAQGGCRALGGGAWRAASWQGRGGPCLRAHA